MVLLNGQAPDSGSARVDLEGVRQINVGRGDALTIQRGPSGIVTLSLPGPSMSARHASLSRTGNRWVLEDQGSRNGTRLLGERVTRTLVSDRELIEVGHAFAWLTSEATDRDDERTDLSSGDLASTPVGLRSVIPNIHGATVRLLRAARADVPILVRGATGTGKELAARAIHDGSGRSGAFVAVNCAALAPALVEASLFGHVRGAFSGADRNEIGLVREADKGTLFLDEIGDLRPEAQAALLRLLQEREVLPVGSSRALRVDVRVVAATHRDLDASVAQGRFRADLLARIRGYVHTQRALAERRSDLGTIVADSLGRLDPTRATRLDRPFARRLVAHAFPGNARELSQVLAAALAVAQGAVLCLQDLPDGVFFPEPEAVETERGALGDEALRLRVESALLTHGGNVSAAARALGTAPTQLRRWLIRLKLTPDSFRPRS